MKTIYLNQTDFDNFIEKKYLSVDAKAAKKGKKTEYEIVYDENIKSEKKEPVFLSNVRRIYVPSAERIPPLKTLYGIPAGLLSTISSVKTDTTLKNPTKKETELSTNELLYLSWRRAMLFAAVWTIKNLNPAEVKSAMNNFLSADKITLLSTWVSELVHFGRYLELKPQKRSIDDTLYEFQFMGMGAFLRKFFFPSAEKMETDHRNWLYQNLYNAIPANPPHEFKGFDAILGAYLIALKASNANQKNLEFVIEKAARFEFDNNEKKFEIIFAAMFFIGLFESKADQYFFVSGASELFYQIEKLAWGVVNNQIIYPDFDAAFQKISKSQLNPLENAVEYYKIKNPSIADIEPVAFDLNQNSIAQQKINIVKPADAEEFLKRSGQFRLMYEFLYKNTFITNDRNLYSLFKLKNLSAILHHKGGIIETSAIISPDSGFVAVNQALRRWFLKYVRCSPDNFTEITSFVNDKLILITQNYGIGQIEEFVLKNMARNPHKIVVFNFADHLKFSSPVPTKKAGEQLTFSGSENYTTQQSEVQTNATLQGNIQAIFPTSECRVITKKMTDEPWEMVLLGIGVLRDDNFCEFTIIDLRKDFAEGGAYEIILRCFRDIIVYDEKQRYMFMNLS